MAKNRSTFGKPRRKAGLCAAGVLLLSLAGDAGVDSLGILTTADNVVINGVHAPTGTTIFSGDYIEAMQSPALIIFGSGSRVQLVKAKARISRQADILLLEADAGLIRFSLEGKGEQVEIRAADRRFVMRKKDGTAVGSVAVNSNGQLAMALCRGTFEMIGPNSKEASEITVKKPMVDLDQNGKGSIQRGGDLLTDASKTWREDELAGKVARIGKESYEILWNSENSFTVNGTWNVASGSYAYQIVDPASPVLPRITAVTGVLGVIYCMAPETISIITPAAASAVGGAVLFQQLDKSETTRP